MRMRQVRWEGAEGLERRELLAADYVVFTADFYLQKYPDVAAAVAIGRVDSALTHFQRAGAREGRQPSELFDEAYYLMSNPDVGAAVRAGAVHSAVEHFVLAGDGEGRSPLPEFSAAYYLDRNGDVNIAVTQEKRYPSAFDHFAIYGAREGRRGNELFSPEYYLTRYGDVAAAVGAGQVESALAHYLLAGEREGREPSAYFDPEVYARENPDVTAAVSAQLLRSGFLHYAVSGKGEGRVAEEVRFEAAQVVGTYAGGAVPTVVGSPDGGRTVVLTDGTDTTLVAADGGRVVVAGFVAKAVSAAGIAGQLPSGRAALRKMDGTMVGIGNLSDGTASPENDTVVYDINDAGAVTGGSMAYDAGAGTHVRHPFVWGASIGMVDLGLPAGSTGGQGEAITEGGMVAGTAFVPELVGTGSFAQSFIYKAGTFKLLEFVTPSHGFEQHLPRRYFWLGGTERDLFATTGGLLNGDGDFKGVLSTTAAGSTISFPGGVYTATGDVTSVGGVGAVKTVTSGGAKTGFYVVEDRVWKLQDVTAGVSGLTITEGVWIGEDQTVVVVARRGDGMDELLKLSRTS